MPKPITPKRAKELSAADYGEASAKFLAQHVVPIFFARLDSMGEVDANNGSAFFIQTPRATFGLTADHVIKAVIEAASNGSFCGIGCVNYSSTPLEFVELHDIEDRIIDRSAIRDIATFRVTDEELERLKAIALSIWPPASPDIGKGVGMCGFPGSNRHVHLSPASPMAIKGLNAVFSFMVFPILAIATNITDRQIIYIFDPKQRVKTQGFQPAPLDQDLGGMSGEPAFAKMVTTNGLEYWAPAGVITDGSMVSEFGKGRIIAARIDECLSEMGLISD